MNRGGTSASESLTLSDDRYFPSAGSGRTSETAPPSLPDYELLRLIGQGSYGQVWLARSVTGALRAIQIVYRASFDHDRPYIIRRLSSPSSGAGLLGTLPEL